MSMIGCFMFKMMKNNNELGNLYKFDTDKYDLDKVEEEVLNKFMKELNENRDKVEDGTNNKVDTFLEDFEMKIEESTLNYDKNKEKLFLTTIQNSEKRITEENKRIRKREIKYFFRNEKIILVPTYKFEKQAE